MVFISNKLVIWYFMLFSAGLFVYLTFRPQKGTRKQNSEALSNEKLESGSFECLLESESIKPMKQ